MEKQLLEKWKNADLKHLRIKLDELVKMAQYYNFRLKCNKKEFEVISYYIGLREGQTTRTQERST